MKNHLFLKKIDEDFYKSGSGKIFQSVHQQNTFFSNKVPFTKNLLWCIFLAYADVIIFHSRPPNSRTNVEDTKVF